MYMKKIKTVLWLLVILMLLIGCTNEVVGELDVDKELVVGESVGFASYDPISGYDGQGFYHYTSMVYEPLVTYENGQLRPKLAKSWEIEDSSITFHLRDDVTFTDGEKFDADVVKLNYNKMNTLLPDYAAYYGGISLIEEVKVIDEYTVCLEYMQPYIPAMQDISALSFGMLSPKLFEGDNNPYGTTLTDTAGTGPYQLKVENIVQDQSYTFTVNEDYYDVVEGPKKVTVKIISDADIRLLALQNEEIDMLYGTYQVTYDMVDQIADTNIQSVISDEVYATRNILLNASFPFLGDVRVRQAISYGINKQQIIDTVLHGFGEEANTLFYETMPFCNINGLTDYAHNINTANTLLDEAGWSSFNDDGFRVKDGEVLSIRATYVSEKPTDEQILMVFKAQMAELGIDIKVEGFETMAWFQNCMNGDFDMTVNDTYGFPQDPYVFINVMISESPDYIAQSGIEQKAKIDEKIMESMATIDEKVVADAYAYILTTLHEEAINVPICYSKEIALINSDKIAEIGFSDMAALCDFTKIIVK